MISWIQIIRTVSFEISQKSDGDNQIYLGYGWGGS